jgi:hypothetical protein
VKSAKQFTTNVVSALTARTRLGQIIKRATQQDERFVAGRRGEPSAVMTFSPMPKELRAIRPRSAHT